MQQLIVIGSDCATLSTQDLLQAADNTTHNKVTIGANLRGGIYLLALHKKNYQRNHFLQFQWCSAALHNDVMQYFAALKFVTIQSLQVTTDVNTTADLTQVVQQKNQYAFLQLLHFILKVVTNYLSNLQHHKLTAVTARVHALRGPPYAS